MNGHRFDSIADLLAPGEDVYGVETTADGPRGRLPLTAEFLRDSPSGDVFGWTQNAGMGWPVANLFGPQVMVISTAGGMRGAGGRPVALGLHSGHFELDGMVAAVADEIAGAGGMPFATFVSDPCDGRTQGTTGMFDSLPYRNDASQVMRRLMRSLPTRRATIGIATCDKGLPATMMALASQHDQPTVLVPGGATLVPNEGEDLAKVQTIGARFANKELTLEEAQEFGCRACASSGGGCHFLGTAGTSQVVAEALGLALPHTALAPSGQPVWFEGARASARAALNLLDRGITTSQILTRDAFENAMTVHAAVGGSTNLLLHVPAIAHAARVDKPTVEDWVRTNRAVPRIVSVLPNGPVPHPTVHMFMAGGTPEVMLHLRDLNLLKLDALTVTGAPLGDVLDWWESSERRTRFKEILRESTGVEPDDVIMAPSTARARGLTPTTAFPRGNIAPQGSIIKSTAIDPQRVGADGVFHHVGPANVFTAEADAIAAIKDQRVKPGDVLVLLGGGPLGTGMEETFQVTSALKYLSYGKEISLITDARFSGVSTGACVGHIGPEALAGGPISKLRNGDLIEIRVDTINLDGAVNFLGTPDTPVDAVEGAGVLAHRDPHPDMGPRQQLPDDTRLWAALQDVSGGTWEGCVYDVDRIIDTLNAGKQALATDAHRVGDV